MQKKTIVAWVALPLLIALGCASHPDKATASAPTPAPTPKPNIVVVLADDLEPRSSGLLPRLPALMNATGTTFTRSYVVQSLCGPSRASLLTGQYAHNHGVIYNDVPAGGFPFFIPHESSTVATWLKGAGYRTALVGKYINGYPHGAADDYVPPGWDYWYGHLSGFADHRYYDYWTNDNHVVSQHGGTTDEYSTTVETKKAVDYINSVAGAPEPIFLYLAPEAPHTPVFYTDTHASGFRDAQCARVPSFNESNVHDKPAWVQGIPYMTPADVDHCDELEQSRLKSMRYVEEELEAVLIALQATGRMDRTFVFYTSDNGLLMGEHRAVDRKDNFYEEAIGVPLIVRGPGVPAGRSLAHPVLNIDLAPTFAELAGIPVPETVDGRSLLPLLGASPPGLDAWRTDFLVESFADSASLGLRNAGWLYDELSSGEKELYDMAKDPYQTENLQRTADPAFIAPLHARLAALQSCKGASCSR